MSAMINSVLTNQFFLMFLAIATGLLIGKIKIGSFSLGVSGGIFTGIVIGYFVTKWAHTVEEGQKYYSTAKRILSTGVVAQAFFTFFLLLFLVSIGMKVGGSIGAIFKKYGSKFVVIGVSIPVVSLIAWRSLASVEKSRAEALSSRMRISGLRTRARAMVSRCFWPPERLPPSCSIISSSPFFLESTNSLACAVSSA